MVVKFRRRVSPEAMRAAGAGWTASLKRVFTLPILHMLKELVRDTAMQNFAEEDLYET